MTLTATAPPPAPPAKTREANSLSRVMKNVTSNWAGIVVSIGLSFVLAPLTVNSLGNVYYGIWTVLGQFTGYLWLFDFGVRESVVKYVAQYHAADDHEELAATVHTAVSIYSIVAVLAMTAVAILAAALPYLFNIPPEAVGTARITALLAGATIAQGFVFNVFVGVLMGLQKFYVMARFGISFGIARAFVVYALLISGYGIIALAVVGLVISVLSNILVYLVCVKHLPYLSIRFVRPRRERTRKLLNYGKYVLISNVGDKLVFATDSIILGIFQPISALTFYAIGGSLIEYLRSFIASMGALLNPLSSSLEARRENAAVASVLLSGTKATVLIGLPICAGFILLGQRFIGLWMGESYAAQAGAVLAVLAVGQLAGLPYYSISGVLYGLGRHRIVALSRIFEGVANVALSVVLVQTHGLIGVALGTVIPHAIVVVGVLPTILPRAMPITLREYYLSTYARPVAASLPFWAVCWLIDGVIRPSNLAAFFMIGTVALAAYVVPAWFIALTADERSHLREFLRRRLGLAASPIDSDKASVVCVE